MTLSFRPAEQAAMEKEISELIRAGGRVPVLELDHLETLDVAAVRTLIVLLRKARESGGDLSLHTTKPQVRRILAVTALDRLFTIRADSEAA
jgi:anti-anti-sigma factor